MHRINGRSHISNEYCEWQMRQFSITIIIPIRGLKVRAGGGGERFRDYYHILVIIVIQRDKFIATAQSLRPQLKYPFESDDD